MTKLISVHYPKASGTSTGTALARALPPGDLLFDYEDDPADPDCLKWRSPDSYESKKPASLSARCVHGHFSPDKYDKVSGLRIVMLRHPIDTVLSIYHYWLQLAETDYAGHRLFQWFKTNRPSITQFSLVPELRYLATRTYFGGYDMSKFAAIGDYADRGTYFAWIEEATGVRIEPGIFDNVTPSTDARRRAESDPSLRAHLAETLADDIVFCARWSGTFRDPRNAEWASRPPSQPYEGRSHHVF